MTTDLPGLRAMAHPLRLRILSLLTGAAMSAAELARELGDSQPNISYHLRRLHDAGLVEVAEQVNIRGGTAKRYRYLPSRGKTALAARDLDDHAMVAVALAAELTRRTAQWKLAAPGTITDAEFWVTPAAWREFLDRIDSASARLHEAAKPPRSPGTVHVSATMSAFQMVDR